jgi:hypothetical protein
MKNRRRACFCTIARSLLLLAYGLLVTPNLCWLSHFHQTQREKLTLGTWISSIILGVEAVPSDFTSLEPLKHLRVWGSQAKYSDFVTPMSLWPGQVFRLCYTDEFVVLVFRKWVCGVSLVLCTLHWLRRLLKPWLLICFLVIALFILWCFCSHVC